ncbi:MAG: class II fructose-bisphosphate aldolase [Acidobacteriia bacterium]|nr:class II fructose-bisphosphate aldolase [Terriglobia bacterium]
MWPIWCCLRAVVGREAVAALKSVNPAILVEGEIGDIGTGSEIREDTHSRPQTFTTASEARQFVEATRCDILAPAVGNTHGMRRSMVAGEERKNLNIDRIREIKAATDAPLTLHGASGTADEDLRPAICAGINIVHINTELRVAWRRGLEQGLGSKDDVVPYKILPVAVEPVRPARHPIQKGNHYGNKTGNGTGEIGRCRHRYPTPPAIWGGAVPICRQRQCLV